MIPKRGTTRVVEDQGAAKKAKHGPLFWPILRGIALIVALCAIIEDLSELLYGREKWLIGLPVFMLATYALIALTPNPATTPAIDGEATEKPRHLQLPDWSLISYFVLVGLGYNWACVFLWFSRRYAFFSAPVVGVTGLILAFYAAIGLLIARLTGGNWRTALLVFALAPGALATIVLRLGVLR